MPSGGEGQERIPDPNKEMKQKLPRKALKKEADDEGASLAGHTSTPLTEEEVRHIRGISLQLLDSVHGPSDVSSIPDAQLPSLCHEIRVKLVDCLSQTGGHLGSSLGVVDLTVALHHVFESPFDSILWDVGHQAYVHKILTGRLDRLPKARSKDGISGFPRRDESEHDPFGTGHASTAASAAIGMAVARDRMHSLSGRKPFIVAVIGDGAAGGGMALEALNDTSASPENVLFVLNDNAMVSLPTLSTPCGAIPHHLKQLREHREWLTNRSASRSVTENGNHEPPAKKSEGHRTLFQKIFHRRAPPPSEHTPDGTENTLFGMLGKKYIGPVNGHDLSTLLAVFRLIKEHGLKEPAVLHVVTQKSHGYAVAEAQADHMHFVKAFDPISGAQHDLPGDGDRGEAKTLPHVLSGAMIAHGERDDRIVVVTAAMPGPTHSLEFGKRFPDRIFDVGIAEQHAVTMAAGMATGGLKPLVMIHSSFLQRAYDQLQHDVAIQHLPVKLLIGGAGVGGRDGPTHAGLLDIAMLLPMPGFVVMAPSDEHELLCMLSTAVALDRPCAIRYPPAPVTGEEVSAENLVRPPVPVGQGHVVSTVGEAGADGRRHVAFLALGVMVAQAKGAARQLTERGLSVTVADARFAKPIDGDLAVRLAQSHQVLITLEEASATGGFGTAVLTHLHTSGALQGVSFAIMGVPEGVMLAKSRTECLSEAGLDSDSIATRALDLLGVPEP